jgi:hypothetical protein
MAQKVIGRTGSRRRHWWLLLCVVITVGAAATFIPGAAAVHDTGAFELDGNATNDPAVAGDDWDNVCHQVTHSDCSTTNDTTGATAVSWVAEPSPNASIFTQSSKDPGDVSTWSWKDMGGLPDKDNLLHSFAARYTTSAGDVLFFGSDRFDNSGDAQQGFWFFQNKITQNADGSFNGVHKAGDLLVVTDFSIGGTTSSITVYAWDPTCTSTTGSTVGACGDANLRIKGTATNANCASASANDQFCGIVNASTITMPWSFTDKSGTPTDQALQGEFFEGGLNLTDLGLAGECFASVSSESRSSTQTTAVLKDFILGSFGNCGSKTVTTPLDGNGNPIPADGVSIGASASVAVKDQAQVSLPNNPGVNPTGTVSFHLCGPTPLSDASYTLCTTGGTAIGSDKTLSGTSNPATVTSDTATVTSAGRYCWRADYSGDTSRNISGSSDSSVTECFKVLPLQPTLATNAGAGPVTLGTPVTDTATLGNTANKPGSPVINPTTAGGPAGGSITFTLYGPNDCTTVAFTSAAFPVSGNGTYGPASFTPTAIGTYHWAASYTGDAPNTLSATHNLDCSDTGEDVVVTSLATHMTSAQSFIPNDSATVSSDAGDGDLAGSVKFELFESSDCSGTAIDTETVPVSGMSPQTVSTNNTTHSTTAANVSWRLTYTSTNPAQRPIPATCLEKTALTIDNDGSVSSSP